MAKKNDNAILKLKAEILKEKEALKKIKSFTPVTNCSLEMDGTRYNLHTLNQEQIINILVKTNALRMSAEDLGYIKSFKLSGYNIEDWIVDLKSRLLVVGAKERETKLKVMETKLHLLLSEDKKVELEFNSILDQFKEDL